jgi:hypothetical protein
MVLSPTPDPGYVASNATAKIDRGLMQGQPRGRCPKLKLVTVTAAAMAIVATDCQVHRERATAHGPGLMQWTTSVPLHPRSIRGLELEQAQDLLHCDLIAKSVEVDSRHGSYSRDDKTARCSRTVPFPYSLWGTGTALRSRSTQALPTTRRTAEPARPLERLNRLAQTLVLDRQ